LRTGKPATRHLAAVERTTAILDALGQTSDAGTNELARTTGINPSSVSRILATLVASGYVEHLPASGRYRIGPRLYQLAHAALGRLDIRQLARPRLAELVDATGETATLSLPAEHDAVTVDYVPGRASVISVARLGRPSLLHCTAVGKVMLAFGPHGVAALVLPLPRFTPATVTRVDRLSAQIAAVRERGYASAIGERESDLAAVAAPVLDREGGLAAILGLQGPAARVTAARLDEIAQPLVAAAQSLARGLGG
jgi:IclR family acetate operon transcriptional repressor